MTPRPKASKAGWRRWCALLTSSRGRAHAALAVILAVALHAGLEGIDFGHHWDEPERIGTLIHAVERGELLPSWYHYPSVVHDLIVLSAAPELLGADLPASAADASPGMTALTGLLKSHAFLLRTRRLFFTLALLSVVATYALVLRARARPFEAVVAAGLVGLSWEFGYHARWIAPDALTAVSAAVVLHALERAAAPRAHIAWLAFAAAAAGVACGTKYPSGLLLLPVIVAAARAGRGRWRPTLGYAGLGILVFVMAYLITTPGTLMQHGIFLADVQFEMQHYRTGHGGGHTIVPGLPHIAAEVEYLSLVALSPYEPIAALFSVLALAGAVWLSRRERWRAALLLSFPLAYVGYMGTQSVMMARNLLVVVPFLAVLSARGAGLCYEAAGRLSRGRTGVVLATAALFSCNGAWLISAARSIETPPDAARELLAFLARESDVPCAVTRRVRLALERDGAPLPASVTDVKERNPQWVAFYSSEVRNKNLWVANRHDYTVKTFGPREVDFNYYPSWLGSDRIVLMRIDDARSLRVIPGL